MGWTIAYRARALDGEISDFVEFANSMPLKLSWGSEGYSWSQDGNVTASGFTKIQFSWRPKTDYKRVIRELKRVAEDWPGIRIDAADDYVLGNWCNVKNIELKKLGL